MVLRHVIVLMCFGYSVVATGNLVELWNQQSDGSEISFHESHREKRGVGAVVAGATIVVNLLSGLGSLGFTRGQAEDAARRYTEQMNFRLLDICVEICVTEWSEWSECSQECGNGGTRTRTRENQEVGRCPEIPGFICTKGLSETAHCNRGCSNGGSVIGAGECKCTPEWRGKCCKQEVRCSHPGYPLKGCVTLTNWPAKYNDVATFSCNVGYIVVGSATATCDADEDWSSPTPLCEEIYCILPTLSENSSPLNMKEEYRVGEQLFHGCLDGYQLSGPRSQTCSQQGNVAVWQGPTPTCLKVKCDNPGTPLHGTRDGDTFQYNSIVRFSCDTGYQLQGSAQMKCMANGYWQGQTPECIVINCEGLEAPENGQVVGSNYTHYGARTMFFCNDGYMLQGKTEVICTEDGTWSHDPPVCAATICPDPLVPNHGVKDGSRYFFPYNVTFNCFPGYTMVGSPVISCMEDGQWDSTAPSCNACPINTYDAGDKEECHPCPSNSHTVTTASQRITQCVCDSGYSGSSGGPCEEIQCPPLEAPENGQLLLCSSTIGSSCEIACNDGFIISRGTASRLCLKNGEWGGSETQCMPCGKDTYKQNDQSCLPCPANSHTEQEGSMIEDCVCDQGYERSPQGQCQDVNECESSNGHCEDVCENNIGSYVCKCSVFGYVLNPDDLHTCIVEKQCRNLTDTDAPDNGGLVCHWYRAENSIYCSVKCNKGYEHPLRINNYESCGSSTGFKWTYQQIDPEAILEPCLEELFGDFMLEAESAYFVRDCTDLTTSEKEEVLQTFANKLSENNICKKNNLQLCDINNMGIICGRVTRVRRDTGETLQSAELGYNIKATKIGNSSVDCPQICSALRIPTAYCDRMCVKTYKKFLLASVQYAKKQLLSLYADESKLALLEFSAAQRQFMPQNRGFKTGRASVTCGPGMMAKGSACYLCYAGTYYDAQHNKCTLCSPGTFQPNAGQASCLHCPPGSTSAKKGARSCDACPTGTYGALCSGVCACGQGSCDPVEGTCQCPSAWEGDHCDRDVDGCEESECASDKQCVDVAAPGMGHTCV